MVGSGWCAFCKGFHALILVLNCVRHARRPPRPPGRSGRQGSPVLVSLFPFLVFRSFVIFFRTKTNRHRENNTFGWVRVMRRNTGRPQGCWGDRGVPVVLTSTAISSSLVHEQNEPTPSQEASRSQPERPEAPSCCGFGGAVRSPLAGAGARARRARQTSTTRQTKTAASCVASRRRLRSPRRIAPLHAPSLCLDVACTRGYCRGARSSSRDHSPRFSCTAGPVLRARCPRRSPPVPLANAFRASFGVPGRQSMTLGPSRDSPNPEARHIVCNVSRETVTTFRPDPRPRPRDRLRRRAGAPHRPLRHAAALAAA